MNLPKYTGVFASLFVISGSVFAAEPAAMPFKLSGYADGAYSWGKTDPAKQGFFVREAAIDLEHFGDHSMALLELPFIGAMATSTSTAPAGVKTYESTFAANVAARAQAYGRFTYSNGMYWQVGRFHTMFGSEGVETRNIRFTHTGYLRTYLMPTAHTALLVGMPVGSDFDVKAYVGETSGTFGTNGSPAAASLAGSSATYGGNFDYGLIGTAKMGAHSAKVGFRTRKDPVLDALEYLADASVSMDLGAAGKADIELAYAKPPTPAASLLKTSIGALAAYTMDVTDIVNAGARFEYVTNRNGTDGKNGMKATVGPAFKMNQNVTFKVDYSLENGKAATGATSVTEHWVNADMVYKF